MKSLRALKAAGLIFAAVVLGLMTVQGSYALWNAGAAANAGTIQAASFDVKMDNGTGTVLMTQANGQPATLGLKTGPVNAGDSAYTGVVLTNDSNAGGPFTVRASADAAQTSSPALWSVEHRAVAGADLGACNAALFTSSQAQTTDIPKGGSGVICFKVSLTASANIQGQASTINIPLSVAQVG
ncbi:hypothetical protein H9639_12180 [Arthrobacter sp. Sa2CUA1]|uniref:SipW-cognate class signal peptide n=1 Tax=Arthrobacter gallicola TaxID=2762225 RepID=A0ABR8UU14_9MICC|nr:hypothetical protein [Arthrobacter gallicola]MBD7996057.1 hypothetical protein [Arthrobacter gallicola]